MLQSVCLSKGRRFSSEIFPKKSGAFFFERHRFFVNSDPRVELLPVCIEPNRDRTIIHDVNDHVCAKHSSGSLQS